MRYFYAFTLLVFLTSTKLYAQSNFKPGYIIRSSGETVNGFIDFREWNNNPTIIRFKPSEQAAAVSLTTKDIKYFDVTGFDTYERYSGKLTMDRTDPYHRDNRDTSTINTQIFLKVIQKGQNAVVYLYMDNVKKRFFVKENRPDATPQELIWHVYLIGGRTVVDETFKQQLFAIANTYKVTNERDIYKLQNAEYKETDVLDAAAAINHASAKSLEIKTQKNAVSVFLGAGVNLATFTSQTIQYNGTLTNSSVFPQLSGGIDVLFNPNTGKVGLRLEALFSENKYSSDFGNVTYPYYTLHYSFTQSAISIVPQLFYNFYNSKNFKIFASPGLQFCILNFNNQKYYSNNNGTITNVNPLFIYSNSFIAFRMHAGVKIQDRFTITAAYQLPQAISVSSYPLMRVGTQSIGFNYYF